MMSEMYQKLAQGVINGELETTKFLALEALEKEMDAQRCITEGLVKGIEHIGKLLAKGERQLPDAQNSIEAMQAALDVLEPALIGNQAKEVIALLVLEPMDGSPSANGKILIGTMLTDDQPIYEQGIPFLHWLA